MISPVLTTLCNLPPISVNEVLRYAGDRSKTEEILALLRECTEECVGVFSNKVAYRILPIRRKDGKIIIGSMEIPSKGLAKNLESCDEVILFCACAGLKIDRLIEKYKTLAPTKALLFHAIGTERVEALCDAFCKALEQEKSLRLTPRFSPGYGDLPLNFQKDILNLLNAGNTVGVCLNESLLLSPSKSVTAFVGIKKERTC